MITKFDQIIDIFKELDKVLYNKVKVYTIGGAVLLERRLKTATKDIDIIVDTKEEFLGLQKALQKIGFVAKIPGKEYLHMNLNQIYQRGEYRIDLFEKEVCEKFSLTESMKSRAQKSIEFDHLTVFFCSNEDILLFKTMTEREGDLIDCESISVAGVDWKIILREIKAQIMQSKQDVWITWIGERLDLLEDRGVIIPIMDEINKLRNKYFDELEKRQST